MEAARPSELALVASGRQDPLLRLDVSCGSLGFRPPPANLRLRFLHHDPAWTLVIMVPGGTAERAAAWLQGQADARIAFAPGIAPKTLRCELATLPPRWLDWLTAARIVQVDLARGGMATLYMHGHAAQVAALAATLGAPFTMNPSAGGEPPAQRVGITARQMEVLSRAVALGYYDVPHRVDLRQLGRELDLSPSAVSLLLRRAQARVIRDFVDASALRSGARMSEALEPAPGPPKGA